MNNFSNAVDWLTPICSGIVQNGKIKLPEMCFWEPYLELKLDVRPTEKGAYEISPGSAVALFEWTNELPGAHDLACKICATNLLHNAPIPEPLRLIGAEVLMGTKERPRGEKADKTWLSNQYKYSLIARAAEDFSLKPTRGDNNAALSACDAVSVAFERAGHHVDYFSLKRLVVEKRYKRLREQFHMWASKAAELGFGVLAERYSIPSHLAPRVADEAEKCDTPDSS